MDGRKGPRTLDQRRSEMLKRAKTRYSERYSISGNLKEGTRAPAKVTLPKIDLKEPSDD